MSKEVSIEGRPDEFLAFSRFKEEIEKQAKQRADEVIAAAKEEASKIIEAGKKEADTYKSELLAKANSEAKQIQIREVSRKKLSVKMDYLKVRDEVFDEIMLEAKSKLQKYSKSKDYADFLSRMLLESALSMNGGELVVHLRSEDKNLLSQDILDKIAEEVTKSSGSKTTISVDKNNIDTLGGLKVVRSDNKLFVDNTFEARLVRMEDDIRVSLVELLEQ